MKEEIRERWAKWREEHPLGLAGTFKEAVSSTINKPEQDTLPGFGEYEHVYR